MAQVGHLSLPNGHAGPRGEQQQGGGVVIDLEAQAMSSPAVMSVRQAAARALQSVPSQGGGTHLIWQRCMPACLSGAGSRQLASPPQTAPNLLSHCYPPGNKAHAAHW